MAPLETKLIFQGPIFHFHDYGRKCNTSQQCMSDILFETLQSFQFHSLLLVIYFILELNS